MSSLPGRPNLDQLRHQARELHRAATRGDEDAVRRVREVSAGSTLAAAQLAIAREYGFASWPKLRAEVARRRAAQDARRDQPDGSSQSWREMREWCARLLRSRTGQGVADWNERIAAESLDDERSLRAWLAAEGVTGYAQALLVWERFGYPGFLVADAEQLIGRQYADRPHLRPIFDAVVAALPALGPVTVQANGTYVSLVSPRRTFAVVKATTKSRVDLGLRLAEVKPEGRLREAKNVGQATVRIPLTVPGEVDDEVLGWLRRAYEENTAPPPPARPARRQGRELGPLTVVIEGSELPGLSCQPEADGTGYRNVHVALFTQSKERPTLVMPGNPWMATEPVPGDSPAARWEVPVTVRQADDGYDFSGPFVRGVRDDRHLGLAWGDLPGDGTLQTFSGAKLRLVDVPPGLIAQAMRPGHRLVARVRLTDAKGNPVTARLHPPYIAWSAEP